MCLVKQINSPLLFLKISKIGIRCFIIVFVFYLGHFMLNRVKGCPAGLWLWKYKPRRARRELFCACYAPRFVKYVKETKHIIFSASVYLKSHVIISTCSLPAYFFRKAQQLYQYFCAVLLHSIC